MKTGINRPRKKAVRGFSYVELMVSMLIISTGFAGYLGLISRIKLTQQYASDDLQSIMLADYQQQNALVTRALCAKP